MSDATTLLHNMSVPPRSTVSYDGLAGSSSRKARRSAGGLLIGFAAPRLSNPRSTAAIIRAIGGDPGSDPDAQLLDLIESRAAGLPLPDGALLVPFDPAHDQPWPDALAYCAIVTKSTGHVWLRSKQPLLSRIADRKPVSLLIPGALARRLDGGRS